MAAPDAILAIDVGGTKMLAALVRGTSVLDTVRLPTPADGDPAHWFAVLFAAIETWQGRYDAVGVAVTGIVDDGHWSALNRKTLNIPDGFPLVATIARFTDAPVFAANDAQAAAWGEYAFGAGGREDMVFLTISTGIGGGIVTGGRLLGGLGGHFGQLRDLDHPGETLEDRVSGRWIAAQAATYAPDATAREVFAAAHAGEGWAKAVVEASARQAANLCRNVQLALDPRRIVIGGSIGLAEGYLSAMERALDSVPPRLKPSLHTAALAENAGVIGIADLAQRRPATMRENGQ
ncbi:ROK family protein [Shinella zoogloeoides]|uniref:ROK family protein n=1 Tax=Shinella zoogloeoides TaxID=352475 RepID=UPI00299F1D5A|nr:ROK family protein [Shinella zoogloeoides]WPE23242.1 N-acetylmannosamine kinase [Shinella zoogloeoides]